MNVSVLLVANVGVGQPCAVSRQNHVLRKPTPVSVPFGSALGLEVSKLVGDPGCVSNPNRNFGDALLLPVAACTRSKRVPSSHHYDAQSNHQNCNGRNDEPLLQVNSYSDTRRNERILSAPEIYPKRVTGQGTMS